MGVHLCPIEPDDWTNGPSGCDEDCPLCGGSGVQMLNGILPMPCNCTTQYEDDDI